MVDHVPERLRQGIGRFAGYAVTPTRFLCDEMLAGLCRWLRAAGYDAELVPNRAADTDILAWARRERRIVLTRDRHLAAAGGPDALLMPDRLDDQARELSAAPHVNWNAAPFTRCLIDNQPLRAATFAEIEQLPGRARTLEGPFRACPHCGRVYWPGSHVRRMLARLTVWGCDDADGPSRAST